jgi:hypothetical protein
MEWKMAFSLRGPPLAQAAFADFLAGGSYDAHPAAHAPYVRQEPRPHDAPLGAVEVQGSERVGQLSIGRANNVYSNHLPCLQDKECVTEVRGMVAMG